MAATFELKEEFGVTHPLQVIRFGYGQPLDPLKGYYMIGPNGTEVPFQQLSDRRIAVRTNLAANAKLTFKLMMGKAPAKFSIGVVVKETPTYYEIRNGLTGVRVLRAQGVTDRSLAPIQGFMLRSGVWTATGPNLMRKADQVSVFSPPLVAKSATTRVIEAGPIETTYEVTYAYDRPAFTAELGTIPAGPGFFKSRITLQSGQPSVLIEDDTDMDLQYALDFYGQVQQDKARWRGHSATAVEYGAEPDGQVLRPSHARPAVDAIRDLKYDRPTVPAYVTMTNLTATTSSIRWMPVWSPWTRDTGWYWMVYNATAGPDAPLVGMFSGRAGSAIGVGTSGVAPWCLPSVNGQRAGGFAMQVFRRGADKSLHPRIKQFWAIFVGTKGADLSDPYATQRINVQMNLHGGINLDKVHRYQTAFADPIGGYQGLFMSSAVLDQMAARARTDPAYAQYLGSMGQSRPYYDLWRDTTGTRAAQLAADTTNYAKTLLNALVNEAGVYDFQNHYWMGGLNMMRHALMFNELIRHPYLDAQSKARLKAAMVLFASILWDDDFVPLSGSFGLGTANMPVQQWQYRNLYTVMLGHHPAMLSHLEAVPSLTRITLEGEINEYGAPRASPHYVNASMGPLLSVSQQLKVGGTVDLFEPGGRLALFANFYLNMLTPPEVRFGGLRKLISIGDGSTEASELYGQMGTGFADRDLALSKRLMQAWNEVGRAHSDFHGTTVLKINDQLPVAPLNLGSSTFPGWCSVLRHGGGTPQETAMWFVNGIHYSDHGHADLGSLALYALKVPLSIDWGSMYYPASNQSYLHSSVTLESQLGYRWDTASVPIDQGKPSWLNAVQKAFEAFRYATRATAELTAPDGTLWTRTVRMVAADANYPVIVVGDRFGGTSAGAGKVFTLNLMAQGSVQSTVGTFEPQLRTWDAGGSLRELPSALPPRNLAAGLSRFDFLGQWGVDFELYTHSSQVQQVTVGNWAHTWHPAGEQNQFLAATGRKFEERQHIFRLKGYGGFDVVLAPFRKGSRKAGLAVSKAGDVVRLKSTADETLIGPEYHAYQSTQRVLLSTSGGGLASAYGIEISGGPVEVVLESGLARITVAGTPGRRTIRLPGTWRVKAPLTYSNGVYTLDYAGGAPVQVDLAP